MSSLPAPSDTETILFAGRARGSPVPTPFPDVLYMLVRQAYSSTVAKTESEQFEDPLESEEPQPLSLTPTPPSPDYTLATPYTDGELEPIKTSKTRVTSPYSPTPPADLATLPSSQQPPLT
ncbi:hypothetical protein Tco_0224067 [Tanacetum coccineum]